MFRHYRTPGGQTGGPGPSFVQDMPYCKRLEKQTILIWKNFAAQDATNSSCVEENYMSQDSLTWTRCVTVTLSR